MTRALRDAIDANLLANQRLGILLLAGVVGVALGLLIAKPPHLPLKPHRPPDGAEVWWPE